MKALPCGRRLPLYPQRETGKATFSWQQPVHAALPTLLFREYVPLPKAQRGSGHPVTPAMSTEAGIPQLLITDVDPTQDWRIIILKNFHTALNACYSY